MTNQRRKTVVILGHSNGDGWAGTNNLFESAPHLRPTSSPNWAIPSERNLWSGIYVATNAIEWPSPAGTPGMNYDIDDIAWLGMTHNLPDSPGAAHPHPSPYTYPNTRGAWYPHYFHDATDRSGGGTFCGVEIPLMWKLSHYWTAPTEVGVGMVKVAVSSTTFLRFDQGGVNTDWTDPLGYNTTYSPNDPARHPATIDPSFGFFVPWWTPSDKFDWVPSTGRLYKLLMDKLEASAEAMPSGIDMDIDTVVCWFGDNDAAADTTTPQRIVDWETEVRRFVKQLRHDIFTNEWTHSPEHQIKIVWMGIFATYGTTEAQDLMDEACANIAENDPYFLFISTRTGETNADLGYSDPLIGSGTHFSANAYIDFADQIFDGIQAMDVDPFDAIDEDDRVTVQSMKDRVRLYYSRGQSNTDVKDAILLQHINGAMFHVLNQCGDFAWFLRHRMDITLEGGGVASPITLPRHVDRILKIEDPTNTTLALKWELLAHTEGGKAQIVLRDRTSGTYTIHYIRMPRELSHDSELMPMPYHLVEWVVVEACFRLARASNNLPAMDSFQKESQKLQVDVLKGMSQMQRGKIDRLHTQRRQPNLFRSRSRQSRWDNS